MCSQYLPAVTGIACSLVGGLITDRLISHGQNVDVQKRDIRVRMTTLALFGTSLGILLLNVVSRSTLSTLNTFPSPFVLF